VISFDGNILVYAADRDAGERHETAVDLLERSIRRGNCIQTLQSFCEFFSVVTGKSEIEASAAAAFVEGWRSVVLVEAATPDDLSQAIRAVAGSDSGMPRCGRLFAGPACRLYSAKIFKMAKRSKASASSIPSPRTTPRASNKPCATERFGYDAGSPRGADARWLIPGALVRYWLRSRSASGAVTY
jgi:hypothetical protein